MQKLTSSWQRFHKCPEVEQPNCLLTDEWVSKTRPLHSPGWCARQHRSTREPQAEGRGPVPKGRASHGSICTRRPVTGPPFETQWIRGHLGREGTAWGVSDIERVLGFFWGDAVWGCLQNSGNAVATVESHTFNGRTTWCLSCVSIKLLTNKTQRKHRSWGSAKGS